VTYLTTVLADNPAHYWRLADGSSLILHDIGSAPTHLAANVTVSGGYTGIESLAGSQFSNTVNGVGFQDDRLMTIASPITVEAWFWQLRRRASEGAIVELGDPTRRWALYVEATGTLAAYVSGVVLTAPAPVASEQAWHQLVLTFDELTARLYFDGALVTSLPNIGHISTLCNCYVGETTAGTSPFCGFVSEVAVFPTALSAARIAAHFAAASPLATPAGGVGGATSSSGAVLTITGSLDALTGDVTKDLRNAP